MAEKRRWMAWSSSGGRGGEEEEEQGVVVVVVVVVVVAVVEVRYEFITWPNGVLRSAHNKNT